MGEAENERISHDEVSAGASAMPVDTGFIPGERHESEPMWGRSSSCRSSGLPAGTARSRCSRHADACLDRRRWIPEKTLKKAARRSLLKAVKMRK